MHFMRLSLKESRTRGGAQRSVAVGAGRTLSRALCKLVADARNERFGAKPDSAVRRDGTGIESLLLQ
jgi:hypothetical protein